VIGPVGGLTQAKVPNVECESPLLVDPSLSNPVHDSGTGIDFHPATLRSVIGENIGLTNQTKYNMVSKYRTALLSIIYGLLLRRAQKLNTKLYIQNTSHYYVTLHMTGFHVAHMGPSYGHPGIGVSQQHHIGSDDLSYGQGSDQLNSSLAEISWPFELVNVSW